ncbi:U-box domain-containing protein 9-like [Salvia hispanica]|uniref:U-box domain-containing protein 9-like n=1 Tax=Salvia hispanica TaxID=49212 RepID=UPI0020096540|nr:U-box domain-containing protein 9-like [Salvia hispanica]
MASEEEDGAFTVKSSDLKRSLRELAFRDDEAINPENLARARQMIAVLAEMELKNGADSTSGCTISFKVPDHFKCPLSNKLMRDPVILLSSGETYDRNSIEAWIRLGNVTSPLSLTRLSCFDLTPNALICNTITTWCENRGIKLLEGNLEEGDDGGVDFTLVEQLLDQVSSSSSPLLERKAAAKKLCILTKQHPSLRIPETAVPGLMTALYRAEHPGLRNDIISVVSESPSVINLLVDHVRLWKGNVQARANAAAALHALALVDSNKALIRECGGLVALISLLENGEELEMKEAASAVHSLCTLPSNKERAIGDGGVRVVMENIKEGVLVSEMVEILALFATDGGAVTRMNNLGAVHCLFKIIKEKPNPRCKEYCVAILSAISYSDRVSWKEVKRQERERQTISKLVLEGTPMAGCILAKLKRSGLGFF